MLKLQNRGKMLYKPSMQYDFSRSSLVSNKVASLGMYLPNCFLLDNCMVTKDWYYGSKVVKFVTRQVDHVLNLINNSQCFTFTLLFCSGTMFAKASSVPKILKYNF